jgi:nitroreductase
MDLETVDHLLTTTHSVKRRLDLTRPVEPEVLERCIEIALHSPTGGNYQGWHFVVVTDSEKRAALADIYRRGRDAVLIYDAPKWAEQDTRMSQHQGMVDASNYLHDHLHEVPAYVIACIESRMEEVTTTYHPTFGSFNTASLYGSILPAVWSIMLALRARGLGSSWTTAHLVYEKEAAEVLGIPDNIIQTALLPVAYFTGADFKPAKRRPVKEVTHWNGWDRQRE